MKGYGQFCPVAKAAEVLTERWTPLVVRELVMGSERFNDIRRGVPLMSPSLLSRRLRSLEEAGVVERDTANGGSVYRLTQAGRELQPLIEQMAHWGNRWVESRLDGDDLDPTLLMWDIRRCLDAGGLPRYPAVIQVDFTDVAKKWCRWWLVVEADDVELCVTDPGREVDLVVRSTLAALTAVWIGRCRFTDRESNGELRVFGDERLKRRFPTWLGSSPAASL